MVYLDYSATTPVLPEIMDSYIKVTNDYMGNTNSLHSLGAKANELLDSALKQICELLKIKDKELVITSGATEANNLALLGTVFSRGKKGSRIIVSKLEHDSIYGICKYLEQIGFKIDYVNHDSEGVVNFEDLKNLITKDTILVSVCAVNSELGIRQPLKTIRQVINKENPDIIFHSDMTQAVGKVPINLSDVDLASFSGHKIYAPKGIGILYKKESLNIKPLMYGASDEIRPGTIPLPLVVSLSKALRLAMTDINKKENKIAKLNEKICNGLNKYPKILINKTKYSIPHILNISLMDIKPETFIHALEKHEIYVGSNTACSSGKISPAILSIYNDQKRALTTIRISLSHLTSSEDISVLLNAFDGIYNRLMELTS